jgi:hypothetical protein
MGGEKGGPPPVVRRVTSEEKEGKGEGVGRRRRRRCSCSDAVAALLMISIYCYILLFIFQGGLYSLESVGRGRAMRPGCCAAG